MLQEDACAHSPCARPHPRKVVAPRGGTPGRGARSVGLKGLPPHGTALLPYENNVGMEVCPLSMKGTERNTHLPGVRDHNGHAQGPGHRQGPDAEFQPVPHALQQLCGPPRSKVTRGSSRSFTEHDREDPDRTRPHFSDPPARRPWEPSCRRGRSCQGDRGRNQGQSGKVVGPRTCRDVACFFITNYLIS